MSTDNFFNDFQQNGLTDGDDEELRNECFDHFDKDGDAGLNIKEFGALARQLFCDESGQSYTLPARMIADMFFVFDKDKDARIDPDEFIPVWDKWIKAILRPVCAFIVVDVQNDFISGSLSIKQCPAGQDGEEVVPVINSLLDNVEFDMVIYSLDWHPEDHVSFIDNVQNRKLDSSSKISDDEVKVFDTVVFEGPPKIEQKLWPRHCVQNSWGAELHSQLKVVKNSTFVYKGTRSDIDSYSAFWDNQKLSETSLDNELHERNVTDVFVCGLAYDVCVGSTAFHALEHGYRTILIHDASRGVSSEDITAVQKKLTSNNAIVVNSDRVKLMVEGRDRRPELGYRTAMSLVTQPDTD